MNMDDFLRTGLHAEAASDTPAFLNFSHTIFIIKNRVLSADLNAGGTAHTAVCTAVAAFSAVTCNISCLFRKSCHRSFPLFLSLIRRIGKRKACAVLTVIFIVSPCYSRRRRNGGDLSDADGSLCYL